MRGIVAFIILTGLLVAPPILAQDSALWQKSTLHQIIQNRELRVGVEPGYKPFEMEDTQGKLIGFDIDIARMMAKAMGVKLKIVRLDWNGMLPGLLTKQFDIIISGMTITSERNLWINFSDTYLAVGQTVLIRSAHKTRVKSYKDLNMKKYLVATKQGTTAQDTIKTKMPKARVQLFDTEAAAVAALRKGEIDAFVYDLPFNALVFQRQPQGIALLDTPFTYERLGWGIRKGDPDFLNWLNHFLDQIKADGTLDTAQRKWFKSTDWYSQVK